MPMQSRSTPFSSHRAAVHDGGRGCGPQGRVRLAGIAAALGLAGMAVAVLANPATVVSEGFKSAIRAEAVGRTGPRLALDTPAAPVVAGTEEYWLGRAVNDAVRPAAWQGDIAASGIVGKRFTLAANGVSRTLEISDVRTIPASAGQQGEAAVAMVLVTCRDVADAGAAPVRLVLEPGQSLPGLPSLSKLHSL